MSTADIVCIASDYCSEIIELNLKGITNSAVLTSEKMNSLKKARTKIANCADLNSDSGVDIDNDEQLISYLYKIYTFRLDNDKYGINKRA